MPKDDPLNTLHYQKGSGIFILKSVGSSCNLKYFKNIYKTFIERGFEIMKGKRTKKFGCAAAAALLAVSALSLSAAAQETETFEVAINEDGEVVTLKNETEIGFSDVAYTFGEGEAEGTLLITQEDGTEHTFEDEDLTEDSDYDVIEKLSFLYVVGGDSKDDGFWSYENADEVKLSEPVTMYVLADMNIREEADLDADIIGAADVGSEVEVIGGTPVWFAVVSGDVNGYIAARYLTEDQEEAAEAAAAKTATSETAQSETSSNVDDDANPYISDAGDYYYQVDGVWYQDVSPDSDAGGYYYQVDGEWYEDVAPDSDAGGYFYYETDDGSRYRIMDSDAVSVGYDEDETEFDGVDEDSDAGGYVEDIDGDVDPYVSDADGYYYQVDGVWYQDVSPDSDAGGYYYQVDGEWYEDVSPDSDAGGYFYYETDDGSRYRIMDSDAVSVGYEEDETEFDDVDEDSDAGGYYYEEDNEWYEDVAPDSDAGGYQEDIDGDVDPYASDAGGYYYEADGEWYEDVAPDSDAGGYQEDIDGDVDPYASDAGY